MASSADDRVLPGLLAGGLDQHSEESLDMSWSSHLPFGATRWSFAGEQREHESRVLYSCMADNGVVGKLRHLFQGATFPGKRDRVLMYGLDGSSGQLDFRYHNSEFVGEIQEHN